MPRKLTALILSPHPVTRGGVVDFIEALARHFSSGIAAERLIIGQRPGRLGALFRGFVPLYDAGRLSWRLMGRRHDVYHLNPSLVRRSMLREGIFLVVLRLFRRRPVLVFIHGWNPECYQRIAESPLWRKLFRIVYGRASKLIVLASQFREDLERLGIPREKIHVLTTMFDGRLLQAAVRQREDREIRVLFLGRFIRSKGIYELLEAFRRSAASNPDLVLIMAGDGPEMDSMQQWRKRHDLAGRVQFPGYLDGAQKARLMANADIFVLASYREGCPLALLEAMACGLPVVVTPVGGIPDVVRDEVNGLHVHPRDADSLARALGRLAAASDRRLAMGARNREEAWRKYEAAKVTADLELHYRQVARGHGPPSGPRCTDYEPEDTFS